MFLWKKVMPMNSNKFFRSMVYGYDTRNEYHSSYRKFEPLDEEVSIDETSTFFEDFSNEIDSKKKNENPSNLEQKDRWKISDIKTLRMQDLERCAIEMLTIINDRGSMRVWNGHCYDMLTQSTFVTEIRKVLPDYLQDKIPSYKSFIDTFQYMKANSDLTEVFSEEVMEETKKMISLKNGVAVADEKNLREHSSDYPIYFTVDAEYSLFDKDTSVMDNLIDKACGNDKSVKKLFYEVLGYIISQNSSIKKFFVFATAPDSGKSIIGEFIGRLLGDNNTSNIELHKLGDQFVSGTISNKVLNFNMDLQPAPIKAEAAQKLKQWTGDARTDSECKYVQGESVYHHCKFLFATNHPVKLKQDDDAFYNRLVLIPFVVSVDECDKDFELAKKLWDSRNAIVTKAVKAYRRLYENNFVFTKCRLADDMIDEWRSRPADYRVSVFVEKMCVIDKNESNIFTPTEELFQAYRKFWLAKGYVVADEDKIMFSKQLHEGTRLVAKKKRCPGYESPMNGYCGIKLKSEETHVFDEILSI